nr:hypothetical protein L203_02210 [Cryptococcus depauperatus CBS 7841]
MIIEPFTQAILNNISRSLIPLQRPSLQALPAHTVSFNRPPSEAAVLIPLLNIDSQPHVLMQVRAKAMRVHAGEVSFPGGKADSTDGDLLHTALREAQEELALPPENVEILGMLDPEYSLGNRARVWPFVGFVHDTPAPFPTLCAPLTSLPLSLLNLSSTEVSALLPLSISALLKKSRQSTHYFRVDRFKPYHKIRVNDLVVLPKGNTHSILTDRMGKRLEVWGLSGWLLNKLAERVGWLKMPDIEPEYED